MNKKLRYFWDYYKWYVIIPILIVIFLIITIRGFFEENRENFFKLPIIGGRRG